MALARTRDLEAVRAGLESWIGAPVDALSEPTGGGMSSETYMFRSRNERLVLRLPPVGDALFPVYDLGLQARVMQQVAGVVPVPAVRVASDDSAFFGTPFVVMEHVDGRLPSDTPSYLSEGWLRDASPAEQLFVQDNFIACCARLHRWTSDQFAEPQLRAGLRAGLHAEVGWWSDYLYWASEGSPPGQLLDVLHWCSSNMPDAAAALSLCWGDVRLPNVIFDDEFEIAAVLDWEMACIAPAEVDLGWWLAIHGMSVEVAGSELPGFRGRDDFIRTYERLLGRALDDLTWYEVWGAFRSAAIMVRLTSLLRGLGVVADDRMRERNPSTKLLRRLLA